MSCLMTRPGRRPGLALKAAAGMVSLVCALSAFAGTDVAGVQYEPTIKVEGQTLQLNGSGISYRALQKLYTIGLYTTRKVGTTEAALSAPGAKQLRFVMLVPMRVDELGKLIARGVEANSSRDEFMQLIPATLEMGHIFSKMRRMSAGDVIAIEWVPNRGTVFFVNGQPAGLPIAHPAFFDAVLKVWVGKKPTTQDLKDALLDYKAPPLLNALE